jgi:hypothetical protein
MGAHDDDALPKLPSIGTHGLMSFEFAITDVGIARGGLRLQAAARSDDGPAGFVVDVVSSKSAETSVPALGLTFHRARVDFAASGAETDTLVRLLARLFKGEPAPNKRARPQLSFDAVSLYGDPKRLIGGRTRLKLFYAEGVENNGAFELLLDVHVPAKRLWVLEKWTKYRPALVHALTFVPARDAN